MSIDFNSAGGYNLSWLVFFNYYTKLAKTDCFKIEVKNIWISDAFAP
jgi:hypothetical protein